MENNEETHGVRVSDNLPDRMADGASVDNVPVDMNLDDHESQVLPTCPQDSDHSPRHGWEKAAPAEIRERVTVVDDEVDVVFRDVDRDTGEAGDTSGGFKDQVVDEDAYWNESVEGDRLVLEEFFAAMEGPSWVRRDNWLSPLPLDQWYGVTVDERGRVSGITCHCKRIFGQVIGAFLLLLISFEGIPSPLPTICLEK